MPAQKLKQFLDEKGVRYVTITHSIAYTAQEIAANSHVRGREMAKTVVIKVNGKLALAVLPAAERVDPQRLRDAAGTSQVEIASEQEFRDAFPGCDVGAMPPFGNLWGMDVYVSSDLARNREIAFNAGSHVELMRLAFADFQRLAQPKILEFASRV
jgi:Ala-tRNA(Pro) deacylase